MKASAAQVRDDAVGEDLLATWVARLVPTASNGGPPALELLNARGPVWSASAGPRTVVFEGVLYNRAELERELGERPDAAALVLSAYERWGLDVLHRIKGIFTLVIWDGEKETAILARDPLGMHPLFYAERGGELLVSASIDPILDCGGVSRALNRAALADHLCQRWPDPGETYFEAIRRVPPNHALLIERGARRLYRYWDPAPPGQEMEWITEDVFERFHDLFDQSVNRCLALGPTAIFLSGGLDSVSVAGVAADNCRAQGLPEPLALSLVFPTPECDEELAQRAVARGLGLEQLVTRLNDIVGEKGLMQFSVDRQAGRQAPLLNHFSGAYDYMAAQARARGIRGVMTGNGGDEWLCVSPLYGADLIRSLDIVGLIRHVRAQTRSYSISNMRVLYNALWQFGLRKPLAVGISSALERVAPGLRSEYRRRVVGKRTPDWLSRDPELRREIQRRALDSYPGRPTDSWYRDDIRYQLDHGITSLEMEEHFEGARETGLRMLSPYWDADLAAFLYRVRPDLLDHGGRTKGLVRDELARRLPDLKFERQKKVSAISFGRSVASSEGERVWKNLGGAPALAELDVVDAQALERQLPSFIAGKNGEWMYLWHVLNLEAWAQSRI